MYFVTKKFCVLKGRLHGNYFWTVGKCDINLLDYEVLLESDDEMDCLDYCDKHGTPIELYLLKLYEEILINK